MKIPLAIAPRAGRVVRAVLRAKALQARPSLQQRAVNRKMLARQQTFDPRLRQHRGEKLLRHLAGEQSVAVFRERRRIPYRVLNAQPDKPAEQQIVLDPLDQLPLRADRVERLQQQRPHQPLRRDRATPDRRVQLCELAGQHRQRGVCDLPNHPQRVIRSNPLFQVYVAEKATTNLVVAAHRRPHPSSRAAQRTKSASPFFSSLLEDDAGRRNVRE